MATRLLTTIRNRVNWQTTIPTLAPFFVYGAIMMIVALFGGR